ncbi:helix-turn-helix transcriptional regulator [Rhizobium sp. ACO-34A]|nr:response regulator transcription factor [Rhizobium sp. ACO-34A]ATN33148.1 helix-turn-helix transcriptional regulator [Rhizobium sp. ACO-34A]
MFMTESHISDPARHMPGVVQGNSILMIARQDLLAECLAEVLSRKFPNHDIIVRAAMRDVSENEENEANLILLYRLSSADIQDVLHRLRRDKDGASIGIVVDGVGQLDAYYRNLAEARTIDGILPLNLRLDVFLAAVDLLAKGGEHFPSALLQRLSSDAPLVEVSYESGLVTAARSNTLTLPNGDMAALTTREVQILDLICEGTQNKIIADRLNLSENTVKVHIRNIYKKMHVRNRTEAASRFFNNDRSTSGQSRRQN